MKKGDKRAQFYIIAAMILIIIVTAILTVTNYSSKNNFGKEIEIRGQELEFESEKVLDYDMANNQNKIEEFTQEYSSYIEDDADIAFIYGDKTDMDAYMYVNNERINLKSSVSVNENTIFFYYNDEDYQFNLNNGKNFYFIILKETGDERYVYTNQKS